jgi:esterase/lipase superfamily enzyme
VAHVLGQKGIPNRVDAWGAEWNHDWPTWRNMMPKYMDELLPSRGAD